jgi:preprotein translocase subunit SecE
LDYEVVIVSVKRRKEWKMFAIIVSVLLLLFVALAGADLLVSNINSDELNNMGVEKKS